MRQAGRKALFDHVGVFSSRQNANVLLRREAELTSVLPAPARVSLFGQEPSAIVAVAISRLRAPDVKVIVVRGGGHGDFFLSGSPVQS
jgi:hypothetical protein